MSKITIANPIIEENVGDILVEKAQSRLARAFSCAAFAFSIE